MKGENPREIHLYKKDLVQNITDVIIKERLTCYYMKVRIQTKGNGAITAEPLPQNKRRHNCGKD